MAQQPPSDNSNPQYDREIVVRDQYQQVMTPGGPVMQSVAVTEQHDRLLAQQSRYRWIAGLIAFFFAIFETMILARITLKLLNANPDNGFIRFIYGFTEPLVGPFLTILPEFTFGNGSILELSSFVAFFAYMIVGVGIDRLLRLLILRPPSGTTATRIERQG